MAATADGAAPDLPALLRAVEAIAARAAADVMAVYAGAFAVERKADASPVTQADRAAEATIVRALVALTPDWPVVAEEAAAAGGAPLPAAVAARRWWWLVDPLDGTREFVGRNGEFTVNVALIDGDAPVLGVVHLPLPGVVYSGIVGHGAWRTQAAAAHHSAAQRRPIRCRACPQQGATWARSRSHHDAAATEAWLRTSWPGVVSEPPVVAGSSLKFGLVAEGVVDCYPRLTPTMEWDTAAGDAVVRAAGGAVTTLDGAPLRYGKPGYANPPFVARGLP